REGHAELERAMAALAAGSREKIGLPWDWRRRPGRGPRPTAGPRDERLLTTPEAAAAIERAGSLTFLIGGYDGSGNFGDIALLDAATSLLSELEGPPLALPVIELGAADSHAESQAGMLHPPEHVVLYDPDGQGGSGLVPVPVPLCASFAACYLYGGGYLNGRWGDRKLAMLEASEAALRAAGATRVLRIASGLQAETAWLEGASVADRARLRLFEPLGVRDRRSLQALGGLRATEATETGDDAVAVLRDLPPSPLEVEPDRLRINVHYAPHDWATSRPGPLLDLLADLLAELGRIASLPVVVRPLIAYLDRRVDERLAADELAAACAARGLATEPPIVLRPASLAESAREMRRARLSVACSYHAALTSLMSQVPTVPVRDTPYYEQKVEGLLEDFGLPGDWALSSTDRASRAAGRIGREVLDPAAMAAHRERLGEGRARMVRRRAGAERQLLERLAAARAGRSLPPAFLSERRDGERRVARAEDRAAEAERRAAPVEAELAKMAGSDSWRLTAPLRALSTRLRARRGLG
ncbi:MAG TPA: polysaccharide pyruvyl transferase family protein, partial [Solirubrobacterales bacterium]|nr:polysaccharide pyruvyl transferase family protein [Solirubrobacterales bacterium]